MSYREECVQRIVQLQQQLIHKQLSGALITCPMDLFYFTGTRQNCVLWVPSSGDAVLMVRKSMLRAAKESAIADVRAFPSSKKFASQLPEQLTDVALTFDALPVAQLNYFHKLLPGVTFVDLSSVMRSLRSVKSLWELGQMRKCSSKLCAVFAQVPQFLQRGMREIDLAAEFEYRARKSGLEGQVRMRAYNQELYHGLVVAGANGAAPGFFDGAVTGKGLSAAAPHGASCDIIGENVPILVDYTGVLSGYTIDMTRMFAIGALVPELQQAFDASLAIQKEISSAMCPGTICSELFAKAEDMAAQFGLGERFMGVAGEQARFVGHGVGLELDEMPVLAKGFDVPLQLNQTVAVEPKFVFEQLGAIGIENTFVVSASGGERLTDLDDALVVV